MELDDTGNTLRCHEGRGKPVCLGMIHSPLISRFHVQRTNCDMTITTLAPPFPTLILLFCLPQLAPGCLPSLVNIPEVAAGRGKNGLLHRP